MKIFGRFVIIMITAAATFACRDLPRDQKGTVDSIASSGRIRVGLIENPPWVIRTEGEPQGAEVELVREFATEMRASPEWRWGGEEKLLGALENFELDVVAGGIGDRTPWSNRVGLTRYYYEEQVDVGVPPGGTALHDLKNMEILVQDARSAGFVRAKGAKPVQFESLEGGEGRPVAAPEWRLSQLGLVTSNNPLHSDRHVVAVPPGENQLVKRLEEFLSKRQDRIPQLLQQQPEVPQ